MLLLLLEKAAESYTVPLTSSHSAFQSMHLFSYFNFESLSVVHWTESRILSEVEVQEMSLVSFLGFSDQKGVELP